jgi:hypothetical protein
MGPFNLDLLTHYRDLTIPGTNSAPYSGRVNCFSCKENGRCVMEIRCEQVRKKLADYREFKIDHPEKGMIERHLFYCPDCIFHLAIITAMSLEHQKIPAGYDS